MNDTIQRMQKQSRSFWQEFREFALRGNVIDLAIGVIIGAAFTGITNSLVKDIVTPLLGLVINNIDFTNLFIDLSGENYPTLAAAQAAGVPTINYGLFLNAVIDFLIIALVVFLVVKQINRLKRQEKAEEPATKNCTFCTRSIPAKALRCPECTAELS